MCRGRTHASVSRLPKLFCKAKWEVHKNALQTVNLSTHFRSRYSFPPWLAPERTLNSYEWLVYLSIWDPNKLPVVLLVKRQCFWSVCHLLWSNSDSLTNSMEVHTWAAIHSKTRIGCGGHTSLGTHSSAPAWAWPKIFPESWWSCASIALRCTRLACLPHLLWDTGWREKSRWMPWALFLQRL